MKKIVVAGAGQLGSRHLQALKTIAYDADVMVIDTSAESLDLARTRFDEIPVGTNNVSVSYCQGYGDLPAESDLVIVASGARARGTHCRRLVGSYGNQLSCARKDIVYANR